MLIGQSILSTSTSTTYYSPWFPRNGDKFEALVEVIKASANSGITFSCTVQTKNNEDADTAAVDFPTAMTITTGDGDVSKLPVHTLLELVRYKYTISSTTTQWVHFRANPPMWYPN